MKTILALIALVLFNGCVTRSYVCNHREEILKLKKENIKFLADAGVCKALLKLDISIAEGGK